MAVVVGAVAMGSGGLQSPPHEQWLVRLGVGGALAAYIVVPTRVPPHEQWLVRLGWVVCCPSYPLGEVG
jgi:hypothetical protein